jgi:predicted MPP superfamily phosphohydrolase
VRIVAFLAIVLAVVVGVHSYLWWRLVRNTTRRGRARTLGTAAIALLAALLPATMIGTRALPEAFETPLAWAGYLWLGVMFYLLVYLLILEVPRLVARLALRARRPEPVAAGGADVSVAPELPDDPSRRLFLARSLAATAGVAAVGTVGYGVRQATGPIPIRRVPVTLDRLAPALDGFRIAVLSDIHLGPTAKRAFLDGVVRTVNRAGVGLVTIVGDLVDGDVAELGSAAAGLRNLESRHGTYFVTGNHEYISGAGQWVEYLPSLDVRVLRNEREEIRQDGAAFSLAGVDDRTAGQSGEPGHGADLDAALAGRDPSSPLILLAHQPWQFTEAARREVDLQLSGHTHGGQLVPFNYLVRLDQPAVAGLSRVGGSQLYVTRGVGTWGPPVRVGAPPEITIVELRARR